MSTFYGTIAGADTYLGQRGFIEWAGFDEDDKTAALIVASEYVDATYGAMFGGEKVGGRAQERLWPRRYAFDNTGEALPADEVPVEAEWATYQLAYRQATAPGSLSADFTASGVIKKAAVEGAVSVEYAGDGSFSDSQTLFPVVDGIIAPILTGSAGFASFSGSRVRV